MTTSFSAVVASMNSTPARRCLRILIVDDVVDAAEALARLLRHDQHEVRTCYSGDSAVQIASEFHPELVLLDIGLPDRDGYAVAEQLRQDPGCRSATIVAVTGYSESRVTSGLAQAGIDRHLVKPVKIDHLQALLAEFFPR
jgi:CheY-like chemotaxis protein